MILTIVGIVLIIVSILLIIYTVHASKHTRQINQEIDKQNKQLELTNQELLHQRDDIFKILELKTNDINNLNNSIEEKKTQLIDIQNNISKTFDNQKELSQKAFENYCEVLDKQYEEEEEEYSMYKDAMQTAYSNLQLQLMKEMDECRAELDKIKETRTAAIQAIVREKEIKGKLSFYCLQISENELRDIAVLESIKPKLINPRILSMLIWKTFFQKPMSALCSNVIGTETKSGIYKITNQKTEECYIGQAIDLASRWKDHAKCGLGIDTPTGNKLYKAMQEFGIWNFSWEILEECPSRELNEKERYYIDLYQAKDYGYNSQAGNK